MIRQYIEYRRKGFSHRAALKLAVCNWVLN